MEDNHLELDRRFLDITDVDPDDHFIDYKEGLNWEKILDNDGIVILGTSGSGKTTEILFQAENLRKQDKTAFVLKLEDLCHGQVTSSFLPEDVSAPNLFKKWKQKGGKALFFLDALDEARLPEAENSSILNQALINLSLSLGSRRKDITIVITSRPSEWNKESDLNLLKKYLNDFHGHTNFDEAHSCPKVKVFRIAPLSNEAIKRFTDTYDINTEVFLKEIHQCFSIDIVRQPLDIQFLIEVWKEKIANGFEADQIFTSKTEVFEQLVSKRVRESNIEKRRSNLDPIRSRYGIEKIAAALTLSGLKNVAADDQTDTLDAYDLLNNDQEGWSDQNIRQLLSTGIFQPSIAGRVSFIHREIQDFLAAKFFHRAIRNCGGDLESLIPLTASGFGTDFIPQSTERLLGWLASFNPDVRKFVSLIKPTLLIEAGDPNLLGYEDKRYGLINHIKLYTDRKLRGEWFSSTDIKKFVDPRLAHTVSELLTNTSSSEAKELLIQLAQFGKMEETCSILNKIACDNNESWRVKAYACRALHEIGNNEYKNQIFHHTASAPFDNIEGAFAAPEWNMFLASALIYCSNPQNPSLEAIAILGKFQRQPKNFSSQTPELLIDFSANIPVNKLLSWLEVFLRFSSGERDQYNYKLPRIIPKYSIFTPVIANITKRVLDSDLELEEVDIILDALELLFQCDENLSIWTLQAPLRELNETLKNKVELKASLIRRRVNLYSDDEDRGKLQYEVFAPLDFNRAHRSSTFFTANDVQYHCNLMLEQHCWKEQLITQNIAWNCYYKMSGHADRHAAYDLLRMFSRKSRFKEIRKKYPSKLKSHILYYNSKIGLFLLYDFKFYPQRIGRAFLNTIRHYRNYLKLIWDCQKLARGEWVNPLINFAKITPNDPGQKTIDKIREKYGFLISEACSQGYQNFWRKHDLLPEHSNTYFEVAGLIGLSIEADGKPINANNEDAHKAFNYAYANLNGFPDWLDTLAQAHPDIFKEVSISKITMAIEDRELNLGYSSPDLNKIAWSGIAIRNLLAPEILKALKKQLPVNQHDLELALMMVVKSNSIPSKEIIPFVRDGFKSAFTTFNMNEAWLWLDALLILDASFGFKEIRSAFGQIWEGANKNLFIQFMGRSRQRFSNIEEIKSDRNDLGNNPSVLKEIIKIAYLCFPPSNDPHHEETYSPDIKDRASSFRRAMLDQLEAIFTTDSLKAYDALINDANLQQHRDLFLYRKDIMIQRASKRLILSQQETKQLIEGIAKHPSDFIEFRNLVLKHLKTLLIKLRDSDDDESAVFRSDHAKEDYLRNWLAARLREVGDGYYTVTREQEVAAEKRPDLRIDARLCELGQIPVEIKLADKKHWTGNDLIEKIETQLAGQYLKEKHSHTGVYVLVNGSLPAFDKKNKQKTTRPNFKKTVDGEKVNFDRLVEIAKLRAVEINNELANEKRVEICFIDLSG